MNQPYLIEVNGLKKYFPLRDGLFGQQTGELRAVDDVSFNIRPGTIFGLVGESGSGKTTVGRTLLGLYERPPAALNSAVRSYPNCQRRQCRPYDRKFNWCFRIPIVH